MPGKHLDAIVSTDADPDCANRRTSDQFPVFGTVSPAAFGQPYGESESLGCAKCNSQRGTIWEPGIERANRSTVDHADNHTNIE